MGKGFRRSEGEHSSTPCYVGTAAWSVPQESASHFPDEGSHLERYSTVLNSVEINTSFYRHHQPSTYARWAATVPAHFRFSVKLSRVFTHDERLDSSPSQLKDVLSDIAQLGEKWGALLIQLPPSLDYDPKIAQTFFGHLRDIYEGPTTLEPRHKTWFDDRAYKLLERHDIGLVQADPDLGHTHLPRTSDRIAYLRLHGSPVIYESRYDDQRLLQTVKTMHEEAEHCEAVWCIFDNTKFGWATRNALETKDILEGQENGTGALRTQTKEKGPNPGIRALGKTEVRLTSEDSKGYR